MGKSKRGHTSPKFASVIYTFFIAFYLISHAVTSMRENRKCSIYVKEIMTSLNRSADTT